MESRDCISMLLCLKENGPMMKTDTYSKVSRNTSMPDKIRALESAGILHTQHHGRITMVELTGMGEAVADHLIQIGIILTGAAQSNEGAEPTRDSEVNH